MAKKRKSGNNGFILLILFILVLTTGVMALIWFTNDTEHFTDVADSASGAAADSGFEVHYMDVEQGDSILVICGNEAMLIDTGELNTTEGIVKYIKELGITELKYVVATHPHSDHIGGMSMVLDSFDVQTFIAPDVTHTTKTFENMLDAIERNNLEITIAKPRDIYTLGDAVLTVMSPNEEYYDELNNYSVVLRAEYGRSSFLFTGDAQIKAENEMLEAGYNLKSDVLKVAHHGSSTSTSARFLNTVAPVYAVISCGENNTYNHPHREVIERLLERNITVYLTKDHGTIVAVSNGTEISIRTSR